MIFCRRYWIIPALAVTLLVLKAEPALQGAPKIDPEDMKNIMLVKDIKAGMKGYGKTVFRGAKIETFGIEVLGVLKKANFGTELIIVKMSGGPMTSRGANLIEGMSGSPVYINGKLIGAFSMGEPFIKEPIGLVTPIEYMLDAWDPKLPTKPSSFFPFSTENLAEPVPLSGRTYGQVTIDYSSSWDDPRQGASDGTLVFRPLATNLMVSGMSQRTISWLAEQLRPLNIRPVAGPGTAEDKAGMTADIEPGSAVGMSFVTGDLDMTGIGTVTYRRGNRILAFGHPMFSNSFMNGLGPVDAALTTAWVYDVFPSIMVSNKVAAPVKPIGRVFQDRPWGIGAEIGKLPKMIPLTVHVNDRTTGRKRTFNVKVVDHPLLGRTLISAACAEAVFEMRGNPTDATAKVKLEVEADEVGTIIRENTFFDPVAIDTASTGELGQLLSMLQLNQFAPASVRKVNVSVDIEPKHQTARLERIFLKEGKFKPGDTVEVGAVLKPYGRERVTRTIKLDLPRTLPSGRMIVQVRGGGQAAAPPVEGASPLVSSAGMSGMSGVQSTVDNLKQLVKKWLEREKNNELVAKVYLPKSAPTIAGEKLTGLPPTIADAMKSSKTTMLGSEREEIKVVVPTDWVILGTQSLPLTVEREDKREKKSPTPRPSEGTPPSGSASESSQTGEKSSTSGEEESGDEGEIAFAYSAQPTAARFEASGSETADTEVTEVKPEIEPVKTERPATTAPAEASGTARPSSGDEKPVGRTPTVWRQTSRSEFAPGKFSGTSATTGDLISLSGTLSPIWESTETYVWCVLPDGKGNIYAGTGNHGIVYKIAPDGTAGVVYDSDELEIHSLALDSAGSLYAGTSPNGIVYRIGPDGKAEKLFDADEKYIVALTVDGKGNVYAATGDKCKVYRIPPSGDATTVLDTSENHALALAVDSQDTLYVGTGLNGIVYRVASDGKVSVLYDAAEDSVTALTVDAQGVLWAGTSPKGVVYKLAPDSSPKAVYDKAGQGIVGIATDGAGGIYAANASSVFRIHPDETVSTLDNERDLQFMCLAVDGSHVYMGTGSIGSVCRAEIGAAREGTYESTAHDCGLESNWGIIDWTADMPKGTSVALRTRTGHVAQPDTTWSEWSNPYTRPGDKITSPPGRYIQYLATLKTEDPGAAPSLKDVSIVYLTVNQAPKVTLSVPRGGEKWSKTKTIKWSGTDPDKDTLTYEIFYSTDDGATWTKLSDKIKAAPSGNKEEPKKEEPSSDETGETPVQGAISIDTTDPEQIMAQMSAELDKHPEIPQDIKDKLMQQAPGMIEDARQELAEKQGDASSKADESPKPPAAPTKQTSFTWDTSKYPDGVYKIKVVGSDRLANPTDAQTGEAVSESIVISNKPPRLAVFKKTLTVQADKSVRVEGATYHNLVGIAGVQYRIGSDDWASAQASDGIFDTPFETFVISTQPLGKGEHTIEVKSIDQAGNSTTSRVTAKVE